MEGGRRNGGACGASNSAQWTEETLFPMVRLELLKDLTSLQARMPHLHLGPQSPHFLQVAREQTKVLLSLLNNDDDVSLLDADTNNLSLQDKTSHSPPQTVLTPHSRRSVSSADNSSSDAASRHFSPVSPTYSAGQSSSGESLSLPYKLHPYPDRSFDSEFQRHTQQRKSRSDAISKPPADSWPMFQGHSPTDGRVYDRYGQMESNKQHGNGAEWNTWGYSADNGEHGIGKSISRTDQQDNANSDPSPECENWDCDDPYASISENSTGIWSPSTKESPEGKSVHSHRDQAISRSAKRNLRKREKKAEVKGCGDSGALSTLDQLEEESWERDIKSRQEHDPVFLDPNLRYLRWVVKQQNYMEWRRRQMTEKAPEPIPIPGLMLEKKRAPRALGSKPPTSAEEKPAQNKPQSGKDKSKEVTPPQDLKPIQEEKWTKVKKKSKSNKSKK